MSYVWWFGSKKKALAFRNDMRRRLAAGENKAELVGPFVYWRTPVGRKAW